MILEHGAPPAADNDRDALLSDFFAQVAELATQAQRALTGKGALRNRSAALAYAVEAGLPPRMAYTVAQTARYTGVPETTLRREHAEGRLAFVVPRGQDRGALIETEEMDRWLRDSTTLGA